MPSGRDLPALFALQPRWFSSDRFYKLYLSPRGIAGAWLAGQFFDEQAASLQLQGLEFLFRPWVRRWLDERNAREAAADACDVYATAFLDLHPRNFILPRADLTGIRHDEGRSLWTFGRDSPGFLHVRLWDGSSRRLILIDTPGMSPIPDALAALNLPADG